MRKAKPCAMCGKITSHLLFKDKILGIPVCSKKCEYQYINNLSPDMKQQIDVIRYLDEKIEETKKSNRIVWMICGLGAVVIVISLVAVNAIVFFAANAMIVVGALLTRYFEDKIQKLTKLRKRILI
jgi:hypothetical protein